MLKRAKATISNYKTILSNLSYLTVLQLINMLLPLATYPFLVRILGKETYGIVIYAQSIMLFVTVFINFGFAISATRQITLNMGDKKAMGDIANAVLIIKLSLFFLAFLGMAVAVQTIPVLSQHRTLFYLCMALPLYETIFPVWYFQGTEKMRFITIFTLTSRLLFTILIFSFVRSQADYLLVPAFTGVGALVAGLLSLWIMYRQIGCSFYFPGFNKLRYQFMDSLPLFVSTVSTQLNNRVAKVLIGTFLTVSDVTPYDLAEKLVEALKTPMGLIAQAIYPKVVKERNKSFVLKTWALTLAAYACIALSTVLLAPFIVHVLGGAQLKSAIPMLQLFSCVLIFSVTRTFFGMEFLIAWGYSKTNSIIIAQVAIIYLTSLFILSKFTHLSVFHYIGLNIASEMLINLLMFIAVKKKGILRSKNGSGQVLKTV